MKLISFKGEGIRGYLNHDIHFRDSVTFLIGINGSGKTSVLQLINGITRPSYMDLESIDYSYIELSLVDEGKSYILSSKKDINEIEITIKKDGNNKVISQSMGRIKPDFRGEIDRDDMEKYSDRFTHLAPCQEILNLISPKFIGIDRMPENDVMRYLQNSRRFSVSPREHRRLSVVDRSLVYIQEIVYDLYRKNAAEQKKYSEEFRINVLKEALSLLTQKDYSFGSVSAHKRELNAYEKNKEQFIHALRNAGIDDAERITEGFFDSQRENLDILSKVPKAGIQDNSTNAIIGWIVGKAQMNAINGIIALQKDYEKKISDLNETIARFTECANLFFKESGKEIRIQDNGVIEIITYLKTDASNNNTHRDEIYQLSSGEKQIIALMGLLVFTPSSERQEVFIIDEPELSLHLTWQEIFVDAILKAQPNFQFILATHSPTIISRNERRSWCEDLSRHFMME